MPFLNLHFKDFNMMKMMSAPNPTINLHFGVPNNVSVIDCWHRRKFRIARILEHKNKCLQYCLNAFYHDIGYIKKATIL